MPENGAIEAAVSADVVAAIESGKIVKWGDLEQAIARPAKAVERPAKVPVPAAISEDEATALAKLKDVFGSVVPDEARKVTPAEVTDLLQERSTIKTIEKMLANRLADISLTILNHNDIAHEDGDTDESVTVMLGADGEPLLNKDGHIVRKAKFYGDDPEVKSHFSVEPRAGKPGVNIKALEAMADDEDNDFISRKDFLAMTTQTRVFDENKAMLYLRKNPNLLRAIREASTTGQPSISVWQR